MDYTKSLTILNDVLYHYRNQGQARLTGGAINDYFKLIITTIYNTLKDSFYNKEKIQKMYPEVYKEFEDYLKCYWKDERDIKFENKAIFDIQNEQDYLQAIIYYISGMTDNFAIDTYHKIIGF